MFVRKKVTASGTVKHYLVESTRVKGKVRQKVLCYLGEHATAEEALAWLQSEAARLMREALALAKEDPHGENRRIHGLIEVYKADLIRTHSELDRLRAILGVVPKDARRVPVGHDSDQPAPGMTYAQVVERAREVYQQFSDECRAGEPFNVRDVRQKLAELLPDVPAKVIRNAVRKVDRQALSCPFSRAYEKWQRDERRMRTGK
jgi:hypothetical protein